MIQIAATDFKATCLDLMDRVAEKKETFIITKRGKPVARLAPLEPESRATGTIFGCMRDRITITGDIMQPGSGDWDVLERWDKQAGGKGNRKRRQRA